MATKTKKTAAKKTTTKVEEKKFIVMHDHTALSTWDDVVGEDREVLSREEAISLIEEFVEDDNYGEVDPAYIEVFEVKKLNLVVEKSNTKVSF